MTKTLLPRSNRLTDLLDEVADTLTAGARDLPATLAADLITVLGDRLHTGEPFPAPILVWLLTADPELIVECTKIIAHSTEPSELNAFCEALGFRHRAITAGGGMHVRH